MSNGLSSDLHYLLLLGVLLVGCDRAPAGMGQPEMDPVAASARALTDYDANGDLKLTKEELKACPGLLSAIDGFDQDRDGAISGDELTSYMQEIQKQGAAIISITCIVNRNNQPLEGATVKLEPEAFMGEAIKPATGITTRDGVASLSIAEEELPQEYRGRLRGVHCGVYRVIVTHPNVEIPTKYNTKTEIGRIVSRRNHETLTINL